MKRQDIIFFGIVLLVFATGVYFIFGFHLKPSDNSPVTLNETIDVSPSPSQIPDNIQIEDTQVGSGSAVKAGDTVEIHYIGYLEDGTRFDTSYTRGVPFETKIGVGDVIKGWDIGVIGMKTGGQRRITIPPELGYGERGSGPIPPNSTLIFDLELVGIK
jgi:FKBP-type peptidyl-prolyl cis-trans isomerase